MRYRVRHDSQLVYAVPVAQAQFNIRLVPWQWQGHSVINYRLNLTPQPDLREEFYGPYCVKTTQVSFSKPIERLGLESEFTVLVDDPGVPPLSPGIEEVRRQALAVPDLSVLSPAPYIFASRLALAERDIADWAAPLVSSKSDLLAAVVAINSAIHDEFTYKPGATTSATPPLEAFHKRAGVCQDFAHVMVIALRSQGIPAAYVSGYLRTVPPPGKERLTGADAMHAWVNVWCGPQLGWVGFDPTNDCRVSDDHIIIGMGRDYADVAPIDGTFIGSAPQEMRSSVDVVAID